MMRKNNCMGDKEGCRTGKREWIERGIE